MLFLDCIATGVDYLAFAGADILFEFAGLLAKMLRKGDGRRVGPVTSACFRSIGGRILAWSWGSTT